MLSRLYAERIEAFKRKVQMAVMPNNALIVNPCTILSNLLDDYVRNTPGSVLYAWRLRSSLLDDRFEVLPALECYFAKTARTFDDFQALIIAYLYYFADYYQLTQANFIQTYPRLKQLILAVEKFYLMGTVTTAQVVTTPVVTCGKLSYLSAHVLARFTPAHSAAHLVDQLLQMEEMPITVISSALCHLPLTSQQALKVLNILIPCVRNQGDDDLLYHCISHALERLNYAAKSAALAALDYQLDLGIPPAEYAGRKQFINEMRSKHLQCFLVLEAATESLNTQSLPDEIKTHISAFI